jgi:DNA-binding SARP family transcriptional activator
MTGPSRVVRNEGDPRVARGAALEVVRVGLLGGFRVSVGARTVAEDAWRLRKARALVALLALEPGHRMHRERLMDLLWPDLDTGPAGNNLRQALHVARRTLAPAPTAASRYLCLESELVSLCLGGRLWVDAEVFEEAAANARRLGEPTAYRAAIGLYAGDLLPQDRYEAWAEDRREGLRRAYLSLLVELAGLHEERGEPGPAIEALRRVVAEAPTHEGAHAGMMRLHALAGRRDEALKQYEQLREALSGELGTAPDPASRRLHADILAGSLSPARPVQETARAGPRHNLPAPRTSFVGREHELVEVGRLLAMTRLLTLTGAGGAGKTRLALEVARNLVGAYPDGVWLVELAGLSEGALVAQAFARALGVREQPGRPLADTLIDALRGRSLLLVVDNCEHLVDEAARLVETLLDRCPDLRVLATSREVLGVAGEMVWRVPSL